mmetsp:Transcript_26136/g.39543  ORF Transcript_26136/g.39543 Transcript_26136/m.39543 type:complete len:178 (+) Transcript_26136:80-613(+)
MFRRWGYTNQVALQHGHTGNDCRGEEHDVTLVWSVASGKCQLLMDGQEVQFIVSRGSIVDHSWTTKGNHVIQVLAHASPPMSSGQIQPNFRQYDLLIDGQSFFTMPKVFELGLVQNQAAYARQPDDMNHKEQEEAHLISAIQNSIAEVRHHRVEKRENKQVHEDSSSVGSYSGRSFY